MPIDDKDMKLMPIPKMTSDANTILKSFNEEKPERAIDKKISEENVPDLLVPAPKAMSSMTSDAYTIQRATNAVERSVPEVNPKTIEINEGIPSIARASVYAEPTTPSYFPQEIDKIKSLIFSANPGQNPQIQEKLTTYYRLSADLMAGSIDIADYYKQMPAIIDSVKDHILNEHDWENLRDAVLRVQNYIMKYLWTDMQKISKAMDTGFQKYQKDLNAWVDKANSYYRSFDFIPKDTVVKTQLSATIDKSKGKDQLMQHMNYLLAGMCSQISPSVHVEGTTGAANKPKWQYPNSTVRNDDMPTNKQLVWIELV